VITAALDFVSSRKWLVELIVLALVAGAVWWLCEHLIAVGVQRQKDADAKAYAQLVIDNAKKEAVLQAKADQAEAGYEAEHSALESYRASQPLHGGLCIDKGNRGVPAAAGPHAGNEATGAGLATVQPLPTGDSAAIGQSDTDIRHMLDILAGRADQVSATLREYQFRANGK
jgi:hypothetical protein